MEKDVMWIVRKTGRNSGRRKNESVIGSIMNCHKCGKEIGKNEGHYAVSEGPVCIDCHKLKKDKS